MKSCIIIGAGISGLVAAQQLIKDNWQVIVLDKGRGIGGRMSTRRVDETLFDHGAQYFSTKTIDFQEFTQKIIDAGVAALWHLEKSDNTFTHPRVIGKNGMNTIPKFLAKGIDIQTNEKVVKILEQKNGCQLETESGNIYSADALIITTPAPQALELLQISYLNISKSDLDILENIQYHPCIAVMAVLNSQTNIPEPGGLTLNNENISWVADNFKKGISPSFAATIHASPSFSKKHFDDDLIKIGKQLLNELADNISTNSVLSYQVHRWRYSLAYQRHPESYLSVNTTSFPLLLAGDGFGIGNVEGAYISGRDAALHLA